MPDSPDNIPDPSRPSFLKRWLGWRALALTAAVLILLSPVLYRGWRLSQVPVIDDPFDVEAFQTQTAVPDEENAAVLMLEATEKLVDVSPIDEGVYIEQSNDGWDPGDDVLDRYLTANQAALEIWRDAAALPNYQMKVAVTDYDAQISHFRDIRDLNGFAVHLIEKSVATGDPQAAIPWIEAMLRNAHLIRQNSPQLRVLTGVSAFAMAANATNEWAVHPELQRDDIERVLGTLIAARQLASRLSENLKAEYLAMNSFLDMSLDEYFVLYRDNGLEPPLDSKWRWWLEAEPEYTLRLPPHVTRNHLLFVDEPRRDRPPLIDGDLFDESAVSPSLRGEISTANLLDLLFESHILRAQRSGLLVGFLDNIDRDEARYRCLLVDLAAQAYFRDRGEFPEKASELVPEYLEEIPDDLYSPAPAPLIYRRDGNGAVVYSRYDNESDDGGTEVDYDERSSSGDLLDFGFRIRNPFSQTLAAPKPE